LIAAVRAWAQDRQQSLVQLLAQQGVLPGPQCALLTALAQEVRAAPTRDPGQFVEAVGTLGPLLAELRQVVGSAAPAPPTAPPTLTTSPDPYATRSLPDVPAPATDPEAGANTSPGPRFRIVRLIGRGGIGEVFIARDEELQRDVALKQMQDRHAYDARSRTRFLREAELTGGLEHPRVVPVHALGTGPAGRPFYAMRLIQGQNLQEALRRFHQARKAGQGVSAGGSREQALQLRKLLRSFLDVCYAVAYAHSKGVIHRDLKPANVMLGEFGETLVVDWGLAKTLASRDQGSGVRGQESGDDSSSLTPDPCPLTPDP